jgi:hypothetical protein
MNKTLSRIIIGVTLLLIIGVAAQYAYTAYPSLFGVTPEVVVVPVAPQLAGSLIMTLQPSIPLGSHAAIYAVSPQTGSMKKIDDTHSYFAPSFSSDGRVAVAAGIGSSSLQLMVVKVSDKNNPDFVVPPAPALAPGTSAWSADNKYIVYDAIAALPTVDDNDIANARVVLLDVVTGTQKILDVGTSPLFLKDGSVVYIKSDGVYRISAQDLVAPSSAQSATRVVYFNAISATRSSHVALSHRGDTLIVSHPFSGLFVGYRVSYAHGVALAETSRVAETGISPVFSLDDKSVAFISISSDAEGHTTKSLAIADLTTRKKVVVKDLSMFTNNSLSLTAWVR